MHEGLPLIIVDDDQAVCELTAEYVHKFYVWGDVVVFSDPGRLSSSAIPGKQGWPSSFSTSFWANGPVSASLRL